MNNFISRFLPSLISFWIHIGLNWADAEADIVVGVIIIINNTTTVIIYIHIRFIFLYYRSMLTVFFSDLGLRFDLCAAESWGISPKLDTLITLAPSERSSSPPPVIPERIF